MHRNSLPAINPSLVPEVLTAFMGMEMEFGESTSWGVPNLKNWTELDKLKFSKENIYYQKIMELANALLMVGNGKFYVGLTDFHPGGDGAAALRDPHELKL